MCPADRRSSASAVATRRSASSDRPTVAPASEAGAVVAVVAASTSATTPPAKWFFWKSVGDDGCPFGVAEGRLCKLASPAARKSVATHVSYRWRTVYRSLEAASWLQRRTKHEGSSP